MPLLALCGRIDSVDYGRALTDAYQRWRASGLDRITKSLEKELIRGWAHWLIPEDRL